MEASTTTGTSSLHASVMSNHHRRAPTLESLPEEGSQDPGSADRILVDPQILANENETTFHASNVRQGNNNNSTTLHSTTNSIPTIPSETEHVSNVIPGNHDDDDDNNNKAADTIVSPYKRLDEDDDALDKIAAWAIHIALIFFCGLVVVAIVLASITVHQYGLVAMMGLLLIGTFSIFLAWFVDKTVLSQDTHFKPIRRKILGVVTAAQQVVVDEYTRFQQDWNEELLLLTANGESSSDENNDNENDNDEEHQQRQAAAASTTKKKKRSVIFKLIKPLLGIRRKVLRRKEKKRQNLSSDYQPPITEHDDVDV
jgi:hypothetical protein